MEMMCACQAIDLGDDKELGIATNKAYNIIREHVEMLEADREMYDDINNLENLIIDEKFDPILQEVYQ